MTTAETEKLYLAHADDLALLLGVARSGKAQTLNEDCVAMLGACPLIARRDPDGTLKDWMFAYPRTPGPTSQAFSVATEIAVAALTDSWRDGLDKAHGVFINVESSIIGLPERHMDTSYTICRANPASGTAPWRELILVERPSGSPTVAPTEYDWQQPSGRFLAALFRSMPEAICAAVHALAEEKRKAEKPTPSTAAVRAAGRILQGAYFAASDGTLADELRQNEEKRIAAIIDEESAKANHGYRLEFDEDRVRLVCPPCKPGEETITSTFEPRRVEK